MFGAIAWGALGGTQLDQKSTKSIPMQRGARSVFCRSVLMQRGARFLIFGVRSMVQHGVDEGVKNIYKTNVILHIFNLRAHRERPPSGSQRTKLANYIGKTIFLIPPLGPSWATSGGSQKRVLAHNRTKGGSKKTLKPFILNCF